MFAVFGLGEALWTVLSIFLFAAWLLLLFQVAGDIFASQDLSGWGKAGWLLFILVLPYIGVLTYVIARGSKMAEHRREAIAADKQAFDSAVREAAGTSTSAAGEIERLASLRDSGTITEAEFQQGKAKVLG